MESTDIVAGRYRLLQRIGAGGMGEVWLAEDRRLKRNIAIKFLKSEYAADDELRNRFENEAQSMARIDHPCVVEIYDIGLEEEQPYMVMEYVKGETFTTFLTYHAPLPERDALQWMESIGRGVAAIHRQKVVHRDLKPNNILIPEGGEREHLIKIVDFGIARHLNSDSITVEGGRLFYTPNFASPEQRAGGDLTPASDIYTIGVIFYEMLGGRQPMNVPEMRGRVSSGGYALLERMLQFDPRNRPQDGSAFLEMLRKVPAHDEPTRALPKPDEPTRVHTAQTPQVQVRPAPAPAPVIPPQKLTPKPSVVQQAQQKMENIRQQPAEELSLGGLLADLFTQIGAGMLWLVTAVRSAFRGSDTPQKRPVPVQNQPSPRPASQSSGLPRPVVQPQVSPRPIGQNVREASQSASDSVSAGIAGMLNGFLLGGVAGMVGGAWGWLLWNFTDPSAVRTLMEAFFDLSPLGLIRFLVPRMWGWLLTAGILGAFMGTGLGGVTGAFHGSLGRATRQLLPVRLATGAFRAMGAAVYGVVLTFVHLLLAAIPLAVWALADRNSSLGFLRLRSIEGVWNYVCYWAALGAIGWAIVLTIDWTFDRRLSRSAQPRPVQMLLSGLLGAVALGGGSFILWVVLSRVGWGTALSPSTILTHILFDVPLKVGLVGGVILGFFTKRPAPTQTVAQVATPPAEGSMNRVNKPLS